jgi:hypothetical protein
MTRHINNAQRTERSAHILDLARKGVEPEAVAERLGITLKHVREVLRGAK